MRWITREHLKIDRIACPWLVTRFIDPSPEFLYVPTDEVLAVAPSTACSPLLTAARVAVGQNETVATSITPPESCR